MLYCNWTESATHPTYVGTYMGTLGNHSLSNQWARYFLDNTTLPVPVPVPPAPNPSASVSINRTWAFTLDGHWFYVLDLGTQGTFVYDKTTQQWSQFYTGGLVNWNVASGTMWGQRIVGCDLSTSDLWEVVPSAISDNGGVFDIAHVVTGGVQTRGRSAITCDGVYVAVSSGIIDDPVGSTMSLRFSDDNGQTWSGYFTVPLTPGAFSEEVIYRSLGSFNMPGRVFELSDIGGSRRIDGCDASLGTDDADPTE